ncbi:ABC transporter permease [Paenibacillus sp. LHD-117]|uniref:ABC transporter permease n=1 Tax=Paenibacillus sp. LHD-117 TaxID=3071412 RepID=UPI0027E17F32|nr:ABC transporter permease [Paenibacillus sp. LHD-117]MDQ6423625.1 ABC transporter permease [Paenibacillus sp. LHD-117]
MIGKAIRADLLKIKGKGIWFLTFLAPIGLIAMQALNYGLRYDHMMKAYADDPWGNLLENILMFVPIALMMGITILSSMLANVEHHTSAWKQLLALPISRYAVFGAKFAIVAMLLAVSCAMLAIRTFALGVALGFDPSDFPSLDVAKLASYPYLASWTVLAPVLWMCVTYRNQSLPITIGIVAALLSIFPISEWVPISWPLASYKATHGETFVFAGLACGIAILLPTAVHFNRKDVS